MARMLAATRAPARQLQCIPVMQATLHTPARSMQATGQPTKRLEQAWPHSQLSGAQPLAHFRQAALHLLAHVWQVSSHFSAHAQPSSAVRQTSMTAESHISSAVGSASGFAGAVAVALDAALPVPAAGTLLGAGLALLLGGLRRELALLLAAGSAALPVPASPEPALLVAALPASAPLETEAGSAGEPEGPQPTAGVTAPRATQSAPRARSPPRRMARMLAAWASEGLVNWLSRRPG